MVEIFCMDIYLPTINKIQLDLSNNLKSRFVGKYSKILNRGLRGKISLKTLQVFALIYIPQN